MALSKPLLVNFGGRSVSRRTPRPFGSLRSDRGRRRRLKAIRSHGDAAVRESELRVVVVVEGDDPLRRRSFHSDEKQQQQEARIDSPLSPEPAVTDSVYHFIQSTVERAGTRNVSSGCV